LIDLIDTPGAKRRELQTGHGLSLLPASDFWKNRKTVRIKIRSTKRNKNHDEHKTPFIIHHSSFTIHHSSFTIHNSSFNSSFIIQFIIHHS